MKWSRNWSIEVFLNWKRHKEVLAIMRRERRDPGDLEEWLSLMWLLCMLLMFLLYAVWVGVLV